MNGARALVVLASLSAWVPPAGSMPSPETPGQQTVDATDPATLLPASAAEILNRYRPAEFEQLLARAPERAAELLAPLVAALAAAEPMGESPVPEYLAASARRRSLRLARAPQPLADEKLASLLALQLVDPPRFVADPGFRERVLDVLPAAFDRSAPASLRTPLLQALNRLPGLDFAASDRVEWGWGAVPRRALTRQASAGQDSTWRFAADTAGRIEASVYSLPSIFFDEAGAAGFLAAVREAAPRRDLVVLSDLGPGIAASVRQGPGDGRLALLDTFGRTYTPWPRDPFSLVRAPDGAVRLLLRPNAQPGREEDAWLGLELIQGLPEELDRAWGGVRWAEAPVPFHNGQVLLTPEQAWVTLHTLEPRVLAILGLDRVPVESFDTADGVDRYVTAARAAAQELAALYGRPVAFVHPLPEPGEPRGDKSALMHRLGGGAGFDLDSIVTLLPPRGGATGALVADVSAGTDLVHSIPAAALEDFRRGFDLAPEGEALPAALHSAQATPRARALDAFLDLAAGHLASQALSVARLPVFLVPTALLRDRAGVAHEDFLITWNNVVVEDGAARPRAEGFSNLLAAGDERAREVFAAAGADLVLFPPLVRSIVLNGGYRCASNHLRRPAS